MSHFCHVEIPTTDVERSKAFYSELFSWKMNQLPHMDYVAFETGKGPGGGLLKVQEVLSGGEQNVMVYVFTESIQETMARAAELGGSVIKERTQIPEIGWYALFGDPEGNVIGLFEPKS